MRQVDGAGHGGGGIMTTAFLQASLAFFAFCAVLGMAVPFLLAAKARTLPLAVLAFTVAAWAVIVLAMAAWRLG